jgi:hypothetical protein
MTPDNDIERVLDAWFAEGPTQMPDRFLADTLDRIDGAPRGRLVDLGTRARAIDPILRFTAAAAVVLAVGGLGALAITQRGGPGGSSSAGSGALPAALQADWRPIGTHELPLLSGTIDLGWDIVIGPASMTIQDRVDVLNSASFVRPDRLELRVLNIGRYWHCQVGDAGTYQFALSAGDQRLTLTPVSDACADRATVLAGDWSRSDLGALQPGRRDAVDFRPFAGGAGGLAYTVPAGWTGVTMQANQVALGRPGVSDRAEIRLFSNAYPSAQDDCSVNRGADVVGRTPAAYAAWLATLPGLVVSTPLGVTIGGLGGIAVDVSMVPGWKPTCAIGVYTLSASGAENGGWSTRLWLNGTDRARYVFLDRGDGTTLVMALEAPGNVWDAFLADATPVIDSFEFSR